MISVIIPIKNKSKIRLQRTINSMKNCKLITEIIIVDYGSDKQINLSGPKIKIIKHDKNIFFNKSHAINLGIKEAKGDYIATVDADILLSPAFLKEIEQYLNKKSFIYTRKVRRIKCEWFNKKLSWSQIVRHSEHWKQWRGVKWTDELSHRGTGGIQIYPKKWAHKVRGADEALVGMGGMDGEMLYRAYNTGLHMIQINELTLHQEHPNMKESQFPPEQRRFLIFIRGLKPRYLTLKAENRGSITNPGYWGNKRQANQKQLINETIRRAKELKDTLLLRDIKVIKLLQSLRNKRLTKTQFKKQMKKITNEKILYTTEDPEKILQSFIRSKYIPPKQETKRINKSIKTILKDKNLSKKQLKRRLKEFAVENSIQMKIKWPKKKRKS